MGRDVRLAVEHFGNNDSVRSGKDSRQLSFLPHDGVTGENRDLRAAALAKSTNALKSPLYLPMSNAMDYAS